MNPFSVHAEMEAKLTGVLYLSTKFLASWDSFDQSLLSKEPGRKTRTYRGGRI